MIMNKRIVLLVVLLLLGQCMWAQSTRVKGKVTDAKTGEVLPLYLEKDGDVFSI